MRVFQDLLNDTVIRTHDISKMPAILQVRAKEGIEMVQGLFVGRIRAFQADSNLGKSLAEQGQRLLVGRRRDEHDVPGQVRPGLHDFQGQQGGDIGNDDQPVLPGRVLKAPLQQVPHVFYSGFPAVSRIQVPGNRGLVETLAVSPDIAGVDVPAGGTESRCEWLQHS